MQNNPVLLSIVTPTYNRAALLKNCFDSLQKQNDLRFEWIIVDDGSSDNTAEVAASFQASFDIISIKKENGGKHTALNAAHPFIHGKYVVIVDSDDYLTDNAVETILSAWKEYEKNEKIGIVTFLRGPSIGHPYCTAPDERTPVDIMRYKRKTNGSSDCCEVIRTELFLRYPFPIFEGERFISEGALWNRVSFTHQCIYINQVIYICNYLDGGLTKSGKSLRIRNPHGGMYTANLNMNRKNFLKRRIKSGLLYTCYGCFAGLSPIKMAQTCDSRLLMWICLPGGWLLYLWWKGKYIKK